MSKKYPKQLSHRDLGVAIFIAEAGAVRLSTLARVLERRFQTPLEPRGVRALGQRLVKHGLAHKERILEGPAILYPTKEALKLAGFRVGRGERINKPALVSLRHSLILAEVRLMYEFKGAKWTCERALREDFRDHLPDGLAEFPDRKVLIELELTGKESNRLQNIILTNLHAGDYYLQYWTTPESFNVVEKIRRSLPKELEERVFNHLLPEAVYV